MTSSSGCAARAFHGSATSALRSARTGRTPSISRSRTISARLRGRRTRCACRSATSCSRSASLDSSASLAYDPSSPSNSWYSRAQSPVRQLRIDTDSGHAPQICDPPAHHQQQMIGLSQQAIPQETRHLNRARRFRNARRDRPGAGCQPADIARCNGVSQVNPSNADPRRAPSATRMGVRVLSVPAIALVTIQVFKNMSTPT
jgi:hypothetical protein